MTKDGRTLLVEVPSGLFVFKRQSQSTLKIAKMLTHTQCGRVKVRKDEKNPTKLQLLHGARKQ